jgi:hypothetical protein
MHEYMKVVSFIEFLHTSESISLSSALTLVPFGLQRYPRHREYVSILITNYARPDEDGLHTPFCLQGADVPT